MDAQAKRKALFRAKLNAQKQGKRIDSPLVRYNENDQPVCRVCEVTLKSDSLWAAHQASRRHHEAINYLKANAATSRSSNSKSTPSKESSRLEAEHSLEFSDNKAESSSSLPKTRPSSVLPLGFFDSPETKRQTIEPTKSADPPAQLKSQKSAQSRVTKLVEYQKDEHSSEDIVGPVDNERTHSREGSSMSRSDVALEGRKTKGALPAGFFDDKDADLRARGITPVKPDAKDEYKEFEKLIQEDLDEVDNRLQEDEIDTADVIEMMESVEQRACKDRVEMLKRKKLELKATRSARSARSMSENHGNGTHITGQEPSHEESSSDGDSDENFTIDWRAKHR